MFPSQRGRSFAHISSLLLGAPRLDQVHDHDVAVAERKMIGVALLLHAIDLLNILKKHGRKLVEALIDDTRLKPDFTQKALRFPLAEQRNLHDVGESIVLQQFR